MTRGPSAPSTPSTSVSRRRFLRAAGATTALGMTGIAAGQSATTFELGGEIPGWNGRTPDAIAGETNPTLSLTPGKQYEITWTNVDGRPHNVVLVDGDGNTLERTAIISEAGATQTLAFTATKEMAEYLCEVHPNSMRGTLQVGETTPTTTSEPSPDRFMPKGPSVRLETVVDGGMTAPTTLEVPPGDDDRRFVIDQIGQVYVIGPNGLESFLDIRDRLVNFDNLPGNKTIDERGLVGITFHPDFDENRRFYLHYSAPPRPGTPEGYTHTQVLSEFRASEDFSSGLPGSERTILEIPSPFYTHNAGEILFGPDGYCYMGMGNGGGDLRIEGNVDDWYKNRGGNGQDVTENLLGSILRIDVDSREDGKPYGIPDDNPLVGEPGLDEHYAWGFRNPWRMSFSDGKLFVCDVGQFKYEEVNVVEKGKNYGWNVREGTHCFASGGVGEIAECPSRTPPDVRGGEPLVPPIIEYPHSYEGSGVGVAVTGGTVYENATIPALRGQFVFGDYSKTGRLGGSVFAATPSENEQWELEEVVFEGHDDGTLDSYVLGVYPDGRGELYVLTTDNPGVRGTTGAVRKIRPPTTGSTTAATATPEQPPTATPTPTPTATPTRTTTATPTATATTTTDVATTDAATDTPRRATTGTETTETTAPASTGESGGWVSRVDGPGFGVAAALAAITGVAARLISKRE